MNALNAPTKKYGQEQMFLMGYSKNSKELEIFNVTKNKDINITPIGALPGMSGGMDDAGIQRFIGKNSLYTFIGWGHSHPGKDSFSPTSPEFNGNGSLKNPVDFVSQGIVNPYSGFSGGNPALIVTPYGFTVYGTFIDGKDTNYSLQNLYDKQPIYLVRDCFDFNGNTVFKQ